MSTAQFNETKSTSKQNGETGLVTQDVSSSIAQAAANLQLTLNQTPIGLPTASTYSASTYPATNLSYPAYSPLTYAGQIPYNTTANVAPQIMTPMVANPYYSYPYAYPYTYFQQTAVSVLPSQAVPPNQATTKIVDDQNSKKNKKGKNQSEQSETVEDDEEDDPTIDKSSTKKTKANNVLPFWGNEKTMNLNPLILTNVQNSPYFKNDLYQLKTYHEVIDEIYYQVKHLEPWERGTRKVSGQTGMCGSVRGVGAGGIVSTAFCILYKLYTLKLTRKQLIGLIKHKDSPYIRAIGFMYIRFTQPPNDFWKWFEPYLEDEEEFEVKAGVKMTIGEMCRHFITKLEWYSTLFPRMPIPQQKELEKQLLEYDKRMRNKNRQSNTNHLEDGELNEEYDNRKSSIDRKYSSRDSKRSRTRSRSRERYHRSKERRGRSRSRERYRDRSREKYRHR